MGIPPGQRVVRNVLAVIQPTKAKTLMNIVKAEQNKANFKEMFFLSNN
jgi:flagellar motility protein MotE (MotC chaperone)